MKSYVRYITLCFKSEIKQCIHARGEGSLHDSNDDGSLSSILELMTRGSEVVCYEKIAICKDDRLAVRVLGWQYCLLSRRVAFSTSREHEPTYIGAMIVMSHFWCMPRTARLCVGFGI